MRPEKLGGKLFGLGLLTAGAIVIFGLYFKIAGGTLPFSGHLYTVSAYVADPQDLLKHGDVDAAGVKVGQISDISNVVVGGQTVADVQMQLNGSVAPLYRDATVIVRQKTLVGENYMSIENRGTPSTGAIPDGGTLPVSADEATVPLDKLLNSFPAPVRTHIAATLQDLGAGFDGRAGDINSLLHELSGTINDGNTVLGALDQVRQPLAQLVDSTGATLQAVANRQADLQTLIYASKATADAVVARDSAFENFLSQLPSTLGQVRTTVSRLQGFSTIAAPELGQLTTAADALRPVVSELGPTATRTRTLVDELGPLATAGNPTLSALEAFSASGSKAIPEIDPMLRQIDPALDYLKPYGPDLIGAFANMGADTSSTPTGRLLHCACPIGLESYDNYTPVERAAVNALINSGVLGGIVKNVINNPYRTPGQLPGSADQVPGAYPVIKAAKPHHHHG